MINIFLSLAMLILATILDSIKDIISFDFENSKLSHWNPNYWKPEAIKRRYKNYRKEDGERFMLSSSTLSFLTNGHDLLRFLRNSLVVISIIFLIELKGIYLIFVYYIVACIVVSFIFQRFYKYMLKNNKDDRERKNNRARHK